MPRCLDPEVKHEDVRPSLMRDLMDNMVETSAGGESMTWNSTGFMGIEAATALPGKRRLRGTRSSQSGSHLLEAGDDLERVEIFFQAWGPSSMLFLRCLCRSNLCIPVFFVLSNHIANP